MTTATVTTTSVPAAEAKTAEPSNKTLWPLTAMCFILGVFIALALKTQNTVQRENLPSPRFSGLAEAYMGMSKELLAYQATIKGLQQTNDTLTDNVLSRAPQMRTLVDQTKQSRFIAGLTPVEGPGILVTLNDSAKRAPQSIPSAISTQITDQFIIHDVDIQRTLNELKAGGGEAFVVNGQRVVATTAIRCVGPAIQVNGVPITPPYKIRVIGDPDTLATCLNLPGGIAENLRSADPAMIAIAKQPSMELPAYSGATQFRYARPVPEEHDSSSP